MDMYSNSSVRGVATHLVRGCPCSPKAIAGAAQKFTIIFSKEIIIIITNYNDVQTFWLVYNTFQNNDYYNITFKTHTTYSYSR